MLDVPQIIANWPTAAVLYYWCGQNKINERKTVAAYYSNLILQFLVNSANTRQNDKHRLVHVALSPSAVKQQTNQYSHNKLFITKINTDHD